MADQEIPQARPVVTRAEAKAAGLKRYYNGKACPRGHATDRFVSSGRCVTCADQDRAAYAASDPEAQRERCRIWRAANPDKVAANNASWFAANRDKAAALWRKHRQENRERRHAQSKAWRLRNLEHAKRYSKAYYAANHDAAKAARNARRARIAKAGGTYTASHVKGIYAEQRGRCGYCRMSIKGGYHVDHIKPLARGGSNWPRNLQLLCAPCNQAKSAKDPIDFARESGLLI